MTTPTHPIPTNIITGFLGVGKTTAINTLLENRPAGESWAVLVNEFGQVGIDQEMMPDGDGLHIKELAGGCICCALGPSLRATVKDLIELARPDRLIIEPTGIGHPEGIIDALTGPTFKDRLDLRATVCLLDPRVLGDEAVLDNNVFHDQLNLADVVLINKCDVAEEAQIAAAEASLGNMFPLKQHVGRTTRGVIAPALLDLVRNGELESQFPEAHAQTLQPAPGGTHPYQQKRSRARKADSVPAPSPAPGQPICETGQGAGLFTCGWVFHRDDCFDFWKLEAVLSALESVNRIKGVIRIGDAWVFYNRVGHEHDFDKVAYRRDSRIEIISSTALDWDGIEKDMLGCLEA
ncbi:GTP-binding protein [Nitrogeniibacter mangrovi]|uniref:GTP-binding protein n=1 Tax=Nitrogeniibacter mangrovi TaxID=2016596 RepID=A0A6C1AY80_9RHOO|nr:GTP-binding protein [Nitrogeniibacter mangrovi]QID16297.1 GTP-binding protein [Nitrogeniibacter mangrovi]